MLLFGYISMQIEQRDRLRNMVSEKSEIFWAENRRISMIVGDLVEQDVDVIVNAANATLLGGGGVDGAIHAAGGPEILAECRMIRRTRYPDGLPTGQAVLTTAGQLPAKAVIHTVGPIFGEENGQEAILLADSYKNSLRLAIEHGFTTIAFPAISTGVYRFPQAQAARIASSAVREFLQTDTTLTQVRFVFYRPEALVVFLQNHVFEAA